MFPSVSSVTSVVKRFVAENVGFVAENGGFCRTMWRIVADYGERTPPVMAFLSALCDLCGKKIYSGL